MNCKRKGMQCARATAVPALLSVWFLPTHNSLSRSCVFPGVLFSPLSGGWIFIIILSVVVPLYVVGGCVYKHQKLGATGMDKCPNVEFWRDLPSLVKDGFAFTYAKL